MMNMHIKDLKFYKYDHMMWMVLFLGFGLLLAIWCVSGRRARLTATAT